MSPDPPPLTAETIGWVERCLGRHASVVDSAQTRRQHRPVGKLTVGGAGAAANHVVLRDGDPMLKREQSRFHVEVAALQAAEDLRIAAPGSLATTSPANTRHDLRFSAHT